MKRILSLTLILALVLSSFSMAFANSHTSFTDVEDEDVMKAVERLKGFGIVDGYEDGTYQPEGMVTRAEFAKLLVTALGLSSAVNANTGSSQFTDVMGGEWFAGHVNVAAGQGIIAGYPDGTFQPQNKVTYGEAVTMLVRALGYKDEFLPGTWPNNYVARAASLDITDDVQFFATGYADRGSVAILLDNTLDANIIEQTQYGLGGDDDENRWEPSETKTILSENLGIDKVEAVELVSSPKVESSLDSDQVEFDATDDTTLNGEEANNNDLPSSIDVDEDLLVGLELRLGESLNIYLDGDNLVYYETAERDYRVVYATIDNVDTADEELDLLLVDGDDPSYDYDEDAVVYIDNEKESSSDDFDNAGNLFGKLVIADNGDVVFADLHDFDEEALIVSDVSDDEFVYADGTDTDNDFEVDDYDSVVVMSSNGELMSFDDIVIDDVVYVNEADHQESGDSVAYLVVVETEPVTEVADRWDSDNDDEFETTDDKYDVSSDATVTDDDKDTIVNWSDADSILNTLTDDEVEVKLLFNLVYEIRHLDSDYETSSDDMYGIITDVDYSESKNTSDDIVADGVDSLTILVDSNDEVTYDLDFDAAEFDGYSDELDLDAGDVIMFTLNSDGEVDSAEKIATEANSPYGTYTTDDLTADLDDDELELDNDDYIVSSDVLALDVSGLSPADDWDDAEFVDYEDLVGSGENDTIIVKTDDDDEVVFMILVDQITADDEYAAYIDDVDKKGGDTYVDLILPGGDEITYQVNNGSVSTKDLIVFEMTGDDINIQSLPSNDFDYVTSASVDVTLDEPRIEVGGVTYKTNSDTIFIDEDGDLMDFDDYEDYLVTEYSVLNMLVDGRYVKVLRIDE